MIEQIFIIISSIGAGWYLCNFYHNIMLDMFIKKLKQHEKEEAAKPDPNVINIRIEEHDNQLFVYNSDTGAYLAHHEDDNEVMIQLITKFPDKKFNADDGSLELLKKRLEINDAI